MTGVTVLGRSVRAVGVLQCGLGVLALGLVRHVWFRFLLFELVEVFMDQGHLLPDLCHPAAKPLTP